MQDMNQQPNPQQLYGYAPPMQPPPAQQPMPPMQPPMQQSMQPPMPQDPERFQQTFQPVIRPPVRRQYFGTDRKGIIFALILLCFSLLCANSYIYATHPGLGASIFTAGLFFTLAVYLFKQRKTVTFYGVFCCIAYLALAVSFSVTGSNVFFVINALFLLSGVIYTEFMQQRRYDGFRSIADLCRTMFVLTFGRIHYAAYALFHKNTPDGTMQKRKVSSVLIGIAIALPFLVVIIPLLILSDAAFEGLLSNISTDVVVELLVSILFGVLVFFLLFGRALCIPREDRKPSEKEYGGSLESVIIIAFLSMICAIYAVYLFTQIAYFFNGFAGILPRGYSVAQYARRGFFEMSIICAINLLIVFLAGLLCKKAEGKMPRAVKLLSLFLCIFSLFLAATVLSKICLYIESFGMTHLRILTFLFTVLLVVLFVSVSIRLFKKNVPYMKIALVTATLLLLFATYADTDRLVAAYNIRAYQSGRLDAIDMETISELDSPTVVPYVYELIHDDDFAVSEKAKRILSWHADELFKVTDTEPTVNILGRRNTDWRAWTYAEQEAADLLEQNINEYYLTRWQR